MTDLLWRTEKKTLTILSGCTEATYGCVTPQAAGLGNPPTSRTRGTPWKKGSANTSHLEQSKRMMMREERAHTLRKSGTDHSQPSVDDDGVRFDREAEDPGVF